MGTINTVMGEVKGEDLGVVDYHEHPHYNAPPWLLREDRDFKLDDVERSAAELRDWTAVGGRTTIKMSAIDFGRDICAVGRIARKVPDVKVVAITGFNKPYFCDATICATFDKDLIKRCVRDIERGIDDTDVKVGLVKGGTGYNLATIWADRIIGVTTVGDQGWISY